ncbi:MAG: NAD(P)/FAD-dependent oxidoreductase, partial [Nitrososphaerales archaeon]
SKGLETTIVEAGARLLTNTVDEETAGWVTEHFRGQGVSILTASEASKFIDHDGRVGGVELTGGEQIRSDFVVVGIGVKPNDQIAQEAGLKVDDGIVVDENLQSSVEGVYAAGDVARFYSPLFGKHLRVEHYDVAFKQGRIAGANMVGAHETFSDPPYFYSFTPGLKIQVWGDVTDHDKVVRRGSLTPVDGKTRFAQFYLKEDMVQAYLSVNRDFKELQAGQDLIKSRKVVGDASKLSDETKDLNTLAG